MAGWTVVWTETAIKQRREILRYWTVRNGSATYSKRLVKLIKERIELIALHPEACKFSEYPNTREAAMGNFSIYYKVIEKSIVVTAFWDNRQDPDKLIALLTK